MTIDLVLDATCAHFGVPRAHLTVRKPNRRTVYVRSIAVFMLRELTPATYQEIAAALDNLGRTDGRVTTLLIQSVKRVVDGEYPDARGDTLAIRKLLTPPPRVVRPRTAG